mmetsp:Transcript_31703/g.40681  ORF Transcript_31703/g.40681 Transcript_31703/m.40681 type:complete len:225 (+) Transcript_31703:444-1118(+)
MRQRPHSNSNLSHENAKRRSRGAESSVRRAAYCAAILSASSPNSSTIRSTKRVATSCLVMRGQRTSMPSRVTSATSFISPPITSPLTSLETIQSQRLRFSLAMASASTSWVSAANPMTSSGRFFFLRDSVARMSGFSDSSRVGCGSPSPSLSFIFFAAARLGRQSATAATEINTSDGKASWQASSISRAVSTGTWSTPSGTCKATGPDTSVTRAPAFASAPAIA